MSVSRRYHDTFVIYIASRQTWDVEHERTYERNRIHITKWTVC